MSSVLDLLAGCGLLVSGALAWRRPPGPLLVLAGVAWLAGDVWSWALYAHRGPLVQLVLAYPRARPASRPAIAVCAAAYIDGLVPALARGDALTVALACAVIALAAQRERGGGAERRARRVALAAAVVVCGLPALGALVRLLGGEIDGMVLVAYEIGIVCVAGALLVDLRRGRWGRSAATGLLLDLGELERPGSLRATLARSLGDPGLAVGYRVGDGYVDEDGRALVPVPGRAVTRFGDAVLVHDDAVFEDPEFVAEVAPAVRLAVANTRLQAEALAGVRALRGSRRRLVEAGDAQRARLQRELHDGAERHLAAAVARLDDVDGAAGLATELRAARDELRRFAGGLHPAQLTTSGLGAALRELAARSAVPVAVIVPDQRFPAAVEAAAYFTCAEALTNVAKYARASAVSVRVSHARQRLTIVVGDDGIGGADPARGSGLRGLADRVDALGGRLEIDSPAGAGTRVTAEIPVNT